MERVEIDVIREGWVSRGEKDVWWVKKKVKVEEIEFINIIYIIVDT